jgi:hypothetical protein
LYLQSRVAGSLPSRRRSHRTLWLEEYGLPQLYRERSVSSELTIGQLAVNAEQGWSGVNDLICSSSVWGERIGVVEEFAAEDVDTSRS